MALHPDDRERHFPEEAPAAWDPIRWVLEENEDWCRDLVEHSQDLLCVHDLEGRFLSVNRVPARLLGYSVEELLGRPMLEFVDPQFRTQFDAYLREIERTGEARGLLAVMTRSGEQRIWEYHNTLRTEGVERPIVRGIAHDVTERVRAEKALRASNEQMLKTVREQEQALHKLTLFRTLLDHSNDAIEVVDPETLRFLDANERAYLELGYSRDELLSMTVFDIAPDVNESLRVQARRQVQESGFVIMETVHQRKDGTRFPVEVTLREVRLDRPYVVAISRDITERKRAEEAVQASERRYRLLFNEMVVGFALIEPIYGENGEPCDYRYLEVNPAFETHSGLPRDRVLGKTLREVLPTLELFWFETYGKVATTGESIHFEHYVPPLGRWLELTAFRTHQGRVAVTFADITERKRAEDRLREFERVVENLEDMVLVVDRDYRYVLVNRAFLKYRRMTKEQVVGRFIGDVMNPELFETVVKEKLDECFRGNVVRYELKQEYPEMGERDLWITYLPVGGAAGIDCAACIFRDITERKRAEEAIATLVQVRADSSENFFTSMACQLAQCLEADSTLIGELIDGENREVKTLGVCYEGTILDNFTYDLAGTPSEEIMEQGACSYFGGATQLFPTDPLLKRTKVEGLAGTPLRNSQGRVNGVMLAAYRRPLADAKLADMILQLFSTRTAAEIERKRTEEALRQSEERFRVALKHSPIAVYNLDRDLRYTWMYNPQLPRPVSEQLGKTAADLFSREEAARITEVRRRVLETGVGARHEVQVSYGGRKQYLNSTIEPVKDAAGAVIGLTGASMDVTALREASEALREAKRKLTEEKLYLEQEIDAELGFGEIIGKSKALQTVMEQVGKVAASEATVLLLGETGTGKELVARAIHRLSQRANSSFIKMNCAAIPSGLLESELFGNEKGAFTGAVSKKIGRLELADKGTLFLDEIGEIPLAVQPKLLRVLQDQEFERLGGTQTLKVDFRLIAATNVDLAEAVRENEFRSDLYYRLNVFPIRVPPLRERREDIGMLVEHFVQKFARPMNKSITSIPKKTMDTLMEWEWPGNVRELENFIERSVILTQGSVLVSPLSEMQASSASAVEKRVDETLEATEREHILRALRESHGQIGGLKGAAMRLGLKRTTLQSKLKHLGINPRSGSPQQ